MDDQVDSGKNGNMTIKDVARALNVSTTTVSRAISGKGRIGEETARRVREYIQEHNYVPNAIAQSLADQKTYNIGVIVPELDAMDSHAFFRSCVTGVCRELSDTLYDVLMIIDEDGDGGKLARALERSEDRSPVFADGRGVLAGLTVEEIASLAARWSAFSRESDPGLDLSQEELEKVKKNSVTTPESGCAGGC